MGVVEHGLEIKRGDIIVVAPLPPFDKPRPAVVVQALVLNDSETVTVALISSDLSWSLPIRVYIQPSAQNGLRKASHVMVDLLATVPTSKVGKRIGTLESPYLRRVDEAIRIYLGL